MSNHLIKQPTAAPVRKIRLAFYTVLLALALVGLAAAAQFAGLDITHLVVAALTALIPLAVGYMAHAEKGESHG